MEDCIFCKIVSSEIPARKVYEDEKIVAFHDLNPQAPLHILVIPKKHIPSLNSIEPSSSGDVAAIFEKIPLIMSKLNISESDGYRLIANCGEKAGQSVFHLHFHILSGGELSWPPG